MTDDAGSFGARLWARRRSAGLSQEELARVSGLSVRTIGNIERDRTKVPHPFTVHRLADALRLSGEARGEFCAAAGRRLAGGQRLLPRQLPGPVPQFTGRHSELAALTGLLDRAGASGPALVIAAIGGMAGVGKTALAVHWAHQVADRFPDGQLYVDLHGYDPVGAMTPPGDALAGFLRALGLAGPDVAVDTDERATAYRSLLAGRRMLVVLDNARDSEQVRPLLPGSPTCVTVVTSRDTLSGLVVRHGAVRVNLSPLPLTDAVGLLRVLIGQRLDGELAAARTLAQQCSRLPLSLRLAAELAVARPAVPLADLASQLTDEGRRLDLLDTVGDQRTNVRAVFSWSYRDLDAAAARTFRLAGLSPGPDLESFAVAALTGSTLAQADRALDQLARSQLIHPVRHDRYGMHDLTRAYARELAGSDSEASRQAALTRLFDHYLQTAGAAMDTLLPTGKHRRPALPAPAAPAPPVTSTASARTWLDEQLPTLLAVVAYAAEQGWPGHAIRLAGTLFRYLEGSGRYAEILTLYRHALDAAIRTGDRQAEADAVHDVSVVHMRQGRQPQAASHLQRALELYGDIGNRAGQANALGNLGIVAYQQGRYPEAISYHERALALYRALGDVTGESGTLCNLGLVELEQCRYEEAAAHLEGSLALFREASNPVGEAAALTSLGVVRFRQGSYQHAGDCHRAALVLCRQTGYLSAEAAALNGLGEVSLATGQFGEARTQHSGAVAIASRIGDTYELARAHDGLARAHQATGEHGLARHHWRKALAGYLSLGAPEAERVRGCLDARSAVTDASA